MDAAQVMTRKVVTVESEDSLAAAAQLMRVHGVGILPVCEAGRVVGVLTDRDIVTRGVAFDVDAGATPVREAMTPEVVCCLESTPLPDALAHMEARGVRRLVVVDAARRLVGLLSLADLSSLPPEALARPPAADA